MAEFETECAALNIPLIVLPPSKPKYNGGVERANRTFREDFYDNPKILADSIGALRFELKKAIQTYGRISPPFRIARPHPNGVSTNQSDKGRMSLKAPELIQI